MAETAAARAGQPGSDPARARSEALIRRIADRIASGTTDETAGPMVESVADFFTDAKWQRCAVQCYRNVFSLVPSSKVREVAVMLKAVHTQEGREEALSKFEQVAQKLTLMKLPKAAELVRTGGQETLVYYGFPSEHWRRIRTTNPQERLMREIRRRARVVGSFPDGNSALMLVGALMRYVAGTRWGARRYLDMELLQQTPPRAEQHASAAS